MTSVGHVLERHRGIGPGFDFLRIALAMAILFTHTTDIVTGDYSEYSSGPWQILVRSLVPMFFALSGFLITGSAQRLRLTDFVLNRAMRIVPALAVDIVVAACIIGPIYTTLSLPAYFSSAEFWRYFANITGMIHYTLPGVFATNINPHTVNGSLWTVPFEIGCYVIMSLCIATGLIGRRTLLAAAAAAFSAAVLLAILYFRHAAVPDAASEVATPSVLSNFTTAKQGYYLYFYFLAGCLAYLYRERIPYHWAALLLSVAVVLGISFSTYLYPGLLLSRMIVCLPFLTYITVFVGMVEIPKIPFYHRGDYSYGIYLYGFPMQQALIATFPGRFTILSHFVCSLMLATAFATFSWHCIEKPILRMRRKFSFTARKTEPEAQQSLPEPEVGSVLNPEDGSAPHPDSGAAPQRAS